MLSNKGFKISALTLIIINVFVFIVSILNEKWVAEIKVMWK